MDKAPRKNVAKGQVEMRLDDSRRLPPLKRYPRIEAAARAGGFGAAGAELTMFPPMRLGVAGKGAGRMAWSSGFQRLPRGVVITEAGRRYLGRVQNLLDQLAEATTDLQRLETSSALTVSCGPSFVARWLIPRLGRLHERHRDLNVRATSVCAAERFRARGDRHRHSARSAFYDGLHSVLLLREDFYPVCGPALLARGPRLQEPADLSQHVLLHQQHGPLHHEWDQRISDQLDWTSWLAAVGVSGIDVQRGRRFSHSHSTLQAAAAGEGVALASSAYIADDHRSTGQAIRKLIGPRTRWVLHRMP